jgi:predicted MFS family arabinose efflux permease
VTPPSTGTVVKLGLAQTLAWASSYYLAAMLATPMATELGLAPATVFAAFSAALIVSAVCGPTVGRTIDRWGGRPVLIGTSLVFAAALAGLALAQGPVSLFAAWLLLGVGMGCGLYEAAFATLVRLHGPEARASITGITLFGGFASTVGWPLSAWLEARWGWRGACATWAALHLLLGLPLNASLPSAAPHAPAPPRDAQAHPPAAAAAAAVSTRRPALLLAGVFAATWFMSTAMAAHLPRLLHEQGLSLAAAAAMGALVGPAQVAGRLLEFGVLRHVHPLLSARLAALLHPIGVAALMLLGTPAAAVFALLHGAGNGILTIAKGTLPLALFGSAGYGQRQGLLTVPARVAQALAPWLFGLALTEWGLRALWLGVGLGGAAFAALWLLPRPPAHTVTPHPQP